MHTGGLEQWYGLGFVATQNRMYFHDRYSICSGLVMCNRDVQLVGAFTYPSLILLRLLRVTRETRGKDVNQFHFCECGQCGAGFVPIHRAGSSSPDSPHALGNLADSTVQDVLDGLLVRGDPVPDCRMDAPHRLGRKNLDL